MSHVLLEAEQHALPTRSIEYQKGKHVMAEPAVLPLRSPLPFAAGKREAVLAQWDADIRKHAINLRSMRRWSGIAGSRAPSS